MSISLFWHPLANQKLIGTGTPQQTADVLRELFGDFPITLNENRLPEIRALRVGDKRNSAWLEIENAILAHNSIVIDPK